MTPRTIALTLGLDEWVTQIVPFDEQPYVPRGDPEVARAAAVVRAHQPVEEVVRG